MRDVFKAALPAIILAPIIILVPYWLYNFLDLGVFRSIISVFPQTIYNFATSLYFGENYQRIQDFLVQTYGIIAFIVLPFTQGFLSGRKASQLDLKKVWFVISLIIFIVDIAFAMMVLHEGIICLIIASPLLICVMFAGYAIGYRSKKANNKIVSVTLIPLLAFSIIYDARQKTEIYQNTISDAVTINAPPDYVWRYIASFPPDLKKPDYWLFKIGLPTPIHSVAAAPVVGAYRECRFTNNLQLKEKIVEAVPNEKLTFVVTEQIQDPEAFGHITIDKGQFILVDNKDGKTTVVANTWYHLFVQPVSYFDFWTADIVRHVHFKILGHIKNLSENDWSKNNGQSPEIKDGVSANIL